MSTVVIMPGGFHPFHAGHLALYQSAQRAFPDAEVFVAATNDTSARPFPFAVKEKLARLAGVDAGHFVQVKSPFRADEITSQFDPKKDVLIFVRSEKDADQPPRPGGVKKDGNPAYLQPLLGAKRLEPFARHAYMAYLPTVEFGPGLTSATEIRAAWPTLTDRRKTALVMSLYPKTQSNAKLAQTVVGMLDAAIGGAVNEEDTSNPDTLKPALAASMSGLDQATAANHNLRDKADPVKFDAFVASQKKPAPPASVAENQGWAATYEETRAYGGQQGAGMTATWQRRENQPVDEDYVEEKWSAKYKRSINCANPRGFSQRAHCAGRRKNEDVAEAFGPLPKDNQQIRLGRHTVDIERVGLDNNYISFAWHDSKGQEHYEEVPVGDLGSYDDLIEKIKQEIRFQERKYTDQGVAEAINPDITNPAFSHQQQIGDYLYVARYWSKGLKISAYDGNKQIGYAELMYQTAPFDDFADPKTTPKRVWLESEWTKVNPKYQRQGIMSTMYAYAKMLGNSVKPSSLRSPDAKAAWSSWRQSGDAKHLTTEEQLDEKCWDTHRQAGMKKKGGRMVPNCVPKESQ